MELEEQLKLAIDLANKYHYGQVDKSGLPYILHPLYVMNNVDGIEAKIVAILHDILEDTIINEQDLFICGFDLNIIKSIIALTKIKGESYDDYLIRVKNNVLARVVKLADLSHNMDTVSYTHLTLPTNSRV